MTERRLTVMDPAGLHARQAARLVQLASRFSSRITIRHSGREADAKSLIEILGLAIGPSTEITLAAEGVDADEAVRAQIAGAIHMIIQISRMRDGMRRITHITEVVGMEGNVITTQDLFTYEFEGEDSKGNLRGNFKSSGLRPNFMPNAQYFGLDRALMEAVG